MKNRHLPIMIGLIVLVIVIVAAAAIVGHKANKKDTSMHMPGASSNESKNNSAASNSAAANKGTNSKDSTNTTTNTGTNPNNTTEANAVTIKDYAFSPAEIKVKVGTKVTWTNQDSVRHTVTADESEGPKSELFGKGETYSFTFTKAGTFAYHCEAHPQMHGTVTVTE